MYTIASDDLSPDDLRSLRRWMLDVHDVRGPIDLRQADPRPGELGTVTDALVVAVGSGGALTAFASALVSWIRHRTSDVIVKVTRPDGSTLEYDGRRVRQIDAADVGALARQLAAEMAVMSTPESEDGN
jgi:cysteine synthase